MKSISIVFLLSALITQAQHLPAKPVLAKDRLPKSKDYNKHIILKAAIGLSYTSAVYLTYRYNDAHIQHESQEGKNHFKDAAATALSALGSDQTHWISLGATAGLAFISKDLRLQRTAVLWTGTLLLNDFFTTSLKNKFQRYRPNTDKGFNKWDGGDGPRINKSFPSGHTSNAFSTATLFSTIYKQKKWVAPVAFSLASLVGVSRIYNNAHWASDVLAGAAVGVVSAKTMIFLDKQLLKRHLQIYPQFGRHSTIGVTYTLEK